VRRHDRAVGRWNRRIRWAVFENVIFIDWREVRSEFSQGKMDPWRSPS
jgi:hypothetical protein